MKTIKLMGFVLCLTWIGSIMPMNAQENLNKLFEKCETLDYVDMNIVEQRNPETKQITQKIVTVSFKDQPALMEEFMAAFEKDKEDATQIISNKQDNKIVPTFFRFKNVSFSFSIKDTNMSITRIEKGGEK